MGKLTTAQKEWLQALGIAGLAAVNLKADAKTAAAKSPASEDGLLALAETTSAETENTRKTPFGPRVPPVDDSNPVAPKVNTGTPHTDHDHLVDIYDREKGIVEQMLWMEVRKSAYYVDNGIVSLTVLPEDMDMDIVTLTVIKMRLKFTGGRKLTVMMNTVTLSGGGGRAMKYERRNGFIIPLDANGEPSYDEYNTPNVIICAKWVDGEIAERKQQRQDIAELTDTMGGAWGGLAGNLSSGGIKSTSTGRNPLPRIGRKGRAGATGKPPTGGGGGSPPVSMKLNEGSKGKKGNQGGGGSGASFKGDGKGTGKPGGKKGGSGFKGGKGGPDRQVISNKQDGDANKEGGEGTGKPTPNQAAPGKTGGGAVKGGAPGGKPAGGSAPTSAPKKVLPAEKLKPKKLDGRDADRPLSGKEEGQAVTIAAVLDEANNKNAALNDANDPNNVNRKKHIGEAMATLKKTDKYRLKPMEGNQSDYWETTLVSDTAAGTGGSKMRLLFKIDEKSGKFHSIKIVQMHDQE